MWGRSSCVVAVLVLLSLLNLSQSSIWDDDGDDIVDEYDIDPFDMGAYDPSAKYHRPKEIERRLPRSEKQYLKQKKVEVVGKKDAERKKENIMKEKPQKEVVEELIVKETAWTVCSGTECGKNENGPVVETGEEKSLNGGGVGSSCLPIPVMKDSQSSAKTYVRRIVKGLLGAMRLKPNHEIHGVSEVPLIARITSKTLKQLEDFASGDESDDSLNNIDRIMSELFQKGDDCILDKKYCIEVDSWRNFVFSVKNFFVDMAVGNLDIWLAIMLVVAVVLVALFTSRRSPLYASLILLGVAFLGMSWYSHYQLLLQRSMAKRQSDMARMSTIPIECKPHEMQMHQMFWHWTKTNIFMGDDPCDKYHEILLVDHTLEVTAVIALWDLFTTVIFHPLDHIGRKAGQFFFHFLGNLSLVKGVVVIVFMGIMTMFILILLCGYQIRLPFWLGGIEPAARRYEPPPPQRVEDITEQIIESVTNRISSLRIANGAEPGSTTLVRRRQAILVQENPEPRYAVAARPGPSHQNVIYEPLPNIGQGVIYTRIVQPDPTVGRPDLTGFFQQSRIVPVRGDIVHGAFVSRGNEDDLSNEDEGSGHAGAEGCGRADLEGSGQAKILRGMDLTDTPGSSETCSMNKEASITESIPSDGNSTLGGKSEAEFFPVDDISASGIKSEAFPSAKDATDFENCDVNSVDQMKVKPNLATESLVQDPPTDGIVTEITEIRETSNSGIEGLERISNVSLLSMVSNDSDSDIEIIECSSHQLSP